MAESELGVLSSQCLGRRIPDKQTLIGEVAAWKKDRNKRHTKADWQLTTADARIKLKRLYPRFESRLAPLDQGRRLKLELGQTSARRLRWQKAPVRA